jgi:CSLREA domain-containing protein
MSIPIAGPYLPKLLIVLCCLFAGCTYQVDSVVDAPDANPGDYVCARAVPPGGFPRGDDGGFCTLRAAIMESNATAIIERIEIPAGTFHLTLPAAEGGGTLHITGSVNIRGAGTASTIIDADSIAYDGTSECPQSGAERRVFTVDGGTVGIAYLTLQDGYSQFGGAILVNAGTTEITDARIRRSGAYTGGGGIIVTNGIVRVRRTSVVENCSFGAFGGGAMVDDGGQLWVYDSLIEGNRSNRAGGIYNEGLLNLRSTTVSGNIADSPEAGTGGVAQAGFAVLNNVTITLNTGIGSDPNSFLGGGLGTLSGGTTVMLNSITAGNDGQGGPDDCYGPLTSDSRYNLIGNSNGCEFLGLTNTYILNTDAQLAALGANGGPTLTHLLLTGSPARNAAYEFPPPASQACEARDQRGVPRPQEGRCDMGSYETGHANTFVTGFMLVDAQSNEDLFSIRNGELLNLAALPEQLSIRAVVSGAPGSIVFAFNGDAAVQTENVAPYAIGGDAPAGDYTPFALPEGAHVIRATPFAGAGGGGAAGGSLELNIVVLGSD